MFSMGSSSGAAIAPLIVVPLAVAFGWRAPFFVNAALGLGWVVVCYRWFRNHPGEMQKITVAEKEFIECNRQFISHRTGFSWRVAFRQPMLWVLIAAYFCVQWANYFFVAWMPNYLQEGKHFSEQEMKMTTSWLFVFATLSAFLSGFFSDWLIRKKGVKLARRLIGAVSFSLMAVMVLISAESSNHLVVAVCLMSAHFFQSPNVINSFASCVEMGGDRAGTVAGIMNFVGQTGAFLMSIFFGRIVDLSGSFDAPQFLMVGVLVAGALLWIRLDVTKRVG